MNVSADDILAALQAAEFAATLDRIKLRLQAKGMRFPLSLAVQAAYEARLYGQARRQAAIASIRRDAVQVNGDTPSR